MNLKELYEKIFKEAQGLPGGVEQDEATGEWGYPDPKELDIPRYEAEEGYRGFEPSLVKLREGQDLGDILDKIDGFSIYTKSPESGKFLLSLETLGYQEGDLTWNEVLKELDMINDYSKSHRDGDEPFVGFVTYDGEKILNFRDHQREERPTSGWAYETKEQPMRELLITPVGRLQGEEFSENLIFKIVPPDVFYEAFEDSEPLFGEEIGKRDEPIYPPEDYPEEGPTSQMEIPVGGTSELEGAEIMSPELRLELDEYFNADLEDDGRVGPRRAALIRALTKLADSLDSHGDIVSADLVDQAIVKIAGGADDVLWTPVGEPYQDKGKWYQKYYNQRLGIKDELVNPEQKQEQKTEVAPPKKEDDGVSGLGIVSPLGLAARELNKVFN